MILLTDTEQRSLDGRHWGGEGDTPMRELIPAVAQAQLRKVVGWGEGPCLHSAEFEGMSLVELSTPQCRYMCPKCWAELRSEVGP